MGFNTSNNTIYVGDADGASKLVGAPLPLGIEYGGTGKTNATDSRNALGAAPISHTHTLSNLTDWPGVDSMPDGESSKLVSSKGVFESIPRLASCDRVIWGSSLMVNGQTEWYPTELWADSAGSLTSTLPVSKGGTGATSAADALKNLGGVSITKLWQNASPTSSFAPQNININLSGYSGVWVMAYVHTNYVCLINTFTPIAVPGLLTGAWGDTGNTFHREFNTSNTEIKFGTGFYGCNTNNAAMLPFQIYGIKGATT